MKKLLTALATAATAALGFAEITAREDFEDSSYRAAYGNDKPSLAAPYDFEGYGDYYRSLDDDVDEELSADGASCVDAVMQFKYADVPDEFDGTEKLVVFANSDGQLVVVDADATNVTTTAITEDTWYRLTIVSVDETVNDATVKKFKVYVNGDLAETDGGVASFTSRVADSNSVATMTLSGTGKVDNFVARTTNPFGGAPTGWIANIGTDDPEQYFTDYTKALKAALAGATLTFADGVTEMDGTAAHPFEIRSAADLKALQAAVADGNGTDKCYLQTANIDMTDAGAFAGIGAYDANPTKGKPFTGTYDGGNFKISNVTMTGRNYGGIFNQVNGGTIKNLTVENISTEATSGEFGYAIVGNAGNGATLENLTAAGTFLSSKTPATHNAAGIVVRACGGGENGTLIKNCTNNAAIYGAYTKLGGICAIAQYKVGSTPVTFQNCSNTGALDISYVNATEDATGFAGILAYSADDAVLEGCSNTGTLTNSGETENDNVKGALVGNVPTKKLTLKSAIASGDIGKFNAGCTVALDFNVSGNNVDFNLYGATGSTVELLQDFTGYTEIGTSIAPALKLSANMTINNGNRNITNATFAVITGTGNLTMSNAQATRWYVITKLQNYSGVISAGSYEKVVFGDIVAEASYGTALVKAGSNFNVDDLASTKVNGAPASLVVDTVDNQKGIYLVAAQVVADDESTTGYATVEKALDAADAAKATSITVYDGSSDEVEGWAYENGVYSRCIAKVGETSYTTLAAAIAAADEGETKTVELIYTCGESVTIPAGVTVNSLTTANDFHGTLAGAGTLYYAMTPSAAPTATDDFAGEVVIGYNWTSNADLKWYGGLNSTIVVTSFTGNNNNTYFPAKEKILSKVRVAEGGTVAINNGWNISLNNFAWTADRVVEIPALKVDGTFSLAYGQTKWNDDSYGAFYVKSLDASGAGSITVGNRFALRIDAVDFAEAPSGTGALVAMTLAGTGDTAGLLYGPNGVAGEKIPVTVNGEATAQTLVYDAVKGGLVLYVAPIAFIYDENGNLLREIPAGDNAVMQAAMAFLQMDIGESIKFASSIENTEFHAMFLAGCTYDATTFTYTRKHEAAVAKITVGQKDYTFPTLAAAIEAAHDGETVVLLDDIAVTEMQCISGKAVTLDLAGFAITAGERSAEAATAGDDSILCVLHGGSLTINDSSAGGTGAITGNSVFTTGVKMTKKGDTDDTNKAALVVNGGTITGYYYGIAGNGLAGRGNTEVTINGGTIKGTCDNDCVAIFQPQLGTLTINGGYLEGAMGVYVKSGTATVAINGGTIKGNGTYAAYVHSTNGFNNTGDAFVVDNAGYPGGAPAPSILGGTFVSVNASAIASYAKTGLERIVHFADKDAVTITEAKASSEDVFLAQGFPGGSDGKTFTIDTAVQAALAEKIPEGKTLADPVEGKTSGVTYAQAYALGLLDEETGDVAKDVTSTIEIVDGKVVVSLDATAKAGYTVMLNVYEKASLTAKWNDEPTKRYKLGSEEEFSLSEGGSGFYKVGVTIEDATSGN